MDCRWCVIILVIMALAMAMPGCQCGGSSGGPGENANPGVASDTALGSVVELRPETQPGGIYPAQPVVPEVPLTAPAPVSRLPAGGRS